MLCCLLLRRFTDGDAKATVTVLHFLQVSPLFFLLNIAFLLNFLHSVLHFLSLRLLQAFFIKIKW